jgi:phosphoribosylanthranilate isomerase
VTVRVKICGITRDVDVEAAVAAGADALGFVFAPRSPRMVDAATAKGLVNRVPAFVCRVGLFMDQDAAEIGRVLGEVPLSLLQFHGREDAAFCRSFGLPYVKALGMAAGADAALRAAGAFPDAAALLLDSHEPGGAGGTGTTFDWNSIPALGRPLVLAGGLTPDNVGRAVTCVRPWAVDVSSGVEDAPGIKNAAKIRHFIQEARREQRSSET